MSFSESFIEYMGGLEEGSFLWLFTQVDFYASFLIVFLIVVPFFLIFWQLVRLPKNSEIWLQKRIPPTKLNKAKLKIHHVSPIEMENIQGTIVDENDEFTAQEEMYFRGKDFLNFLHISKDR